MGFLHFWNPPYVKPINVIYWWWNPHLWLVNAKQNPFGGFLKWGTPGCSPSYLLLWMWKPMACWGYPNFEKHIISFTGGIKKLWFDRWVVKSTTMFPGKSRFNDGLRHHNLFCGGPDPGPVPQWFYVIPATCSQAASSQSFFVFLSGGTNITHFKWGL